LKKSLETLKGIDNEFDSNNKPRPNKPYKPLRVNRT